MASLPARSVVASTLLGTVPPRLPGRLLVAFAEEFGIRPGTTRVALSRMVDAGELTRSENGAYALAGALLERHHRQEAGLAAVPTPWDGHWEIWIVPAGARTSGDRAALRQAGRHLGLGERRDGVWMRPANLAADRAPEARATIDAQSERYLAVPEGDGCGLVADLFDLDQWSAGAHRLIEHVETKLDSSLSDGFELSAAVLRHLVADPLLPVELQPDGWPAAELRRAYRGYDVDYRARLASFFRRTMSP